jgi:hypothetical protein
MSTITFEQFYHQCLQEEMMSATVFGLGAAGDHGGEVPGGSDFYATGSAVVPKILGAKKRRGKTPIQRRSLP